MKVKVRVELDARKYGARIEDMGEIDLDDYETRITLTAAGCTLPPEPKQVEPVEFKVTDGHGYIEQIDRVPYIAEVKKGAYPDCLRLCIQANFANEFEKQYKAYFEKEMYPFWLLKLHCDLLEQLKGV